MTAIFYILGIVFENIVTLSWVNMYQVFQDYPSPPGWGRVWYLPPKDEQECDIHTHRNTSKMRESVIFLQKDDCLCDLSGKIMIFWMTETVIYGKAYVRIRTSSKNISAFPTKHSENATAASLSKVRFPINKVQPGCLVTLLQSIMLDVSREPLNCGVQSLVSSIWTLKLSSLLPRLSNVLLLFMNIRHLDLPFKHSITESEGFRNYQRIDIIRNCVTCCKR